MLVVLVQKVLQIAGSLLTAVLRGQSNVECKREGEQDEIPNQGDEDYFENDEEFNIEFTEAVDEMLG